MRVVAEKEEVMKSGGEGGTSKGVWGGDRHLQQNCTNIPET